MSHDQAKEEPERFGEFVVEGVLGRGGMGLVYAARAPDGRRAAVKVMKVADQDVSRYLARFEREAGLEIDHPNVVRVLGSGVAADQSPYIAFELLEGEGLDRRIRREVLALPEVIAIARQVCDGLEAVHRAGIVHRDLKPGNVFLCADGPVKLLDFGVARWGEATTDLTQGAIVGTPSYLSPEQARAHSSVDGRADVWAFGVLLYEILTGSRPFKRDSPLTTMMAVVMDDPAPLSAHVFNVPDALSDVVMRCLAKRRSGRYQTAAELRAALDEVPLDGPPLERVEEREVTLDEVSFDHDSATRTELSRPSQITISPDEQRLVVVVLAVGLRDEEVFDDAINERGGSVVRFRGRQAIGIFGLHEWEGDEIVRAGRAGVAVRHVCDAVSVATGRAFQRGQGVAGAAVDRAERGVAARLEGVAVSREAVGALSDAFSLREIDERLSEIVEESVAPPRKPERAPMHGRDAELDALLVQIDETTSSGAASASVIVGPLGAGKTRLRQALADAVVDRAPDVRVLVGRADPRRRDVAMQLISSVLQRRAWLGNLLRSWPDISPAADIEERREAVATLVSEAIADQAPAHECGEILGELLGVPMPDSTALVAARGDPQLMTDRVRLALTDYFGALAAERPLALLLEDLQWADAASVAFLEDLLDELAFSPIFVLATGRPELEDRYPGLFMDRGAARVSLGPLRPAAAVAVARDIGGQELPKELLEPLIKRADGNPLFILEIMRALSATTDLHVGDETDIPLPPSVEAAVQSRLDRIPDHERTAVKHASVFQRAITEDDLRELGIDDAGRALAGLARRGVLAGRQRVGARGREYRFRSTLLAEVALGSLSPEFRAELNRRVAAHLSRAADAEPEEIAFHWEAAGHGRRAGEWYARAAIAAERRGDAGEVIRCADRSIALGLPEDQVFEVQLARADALRFTGDREAQRKALVEALAHAKDARDRARALTELGYCQFRLGEGEEAFGTVAAAVAAARESGDANLLALALRRDVTLRILTGDLSGAEERYFEAARLVLTDGHAHTRALLAECEGLLANATGDVGRQMLAFSEAARLYGELGDLRRSAGAANNVADAHNRLGDFAAAQTALREAVTKCRRLGNRSVEGYALVNLGYALTGMGQTDEAEEALAQAESLAESNQDKRLALFVALYRARNRLRRSDDREAAVEAGRLADDAAHEADRLSMSGARVLALTLAAKAMLRASMKEGAIGRSTEAMNLRDQIGGAQEDEAEVFLTHARALAANGLPDDAEAILDRGRDRLQKVAARIADPELRERFLRDVPANRELWESG